MENTPTIQSPERIEWLKRVEIAPPPAWVKIRKVDEAFRFPASESFSGLLIDRQHHVAERAVHERIVQRIETLQAVQHASQWRFDFDPAMQRVCIHSIVVRRDGRAHEHAVAERLRLLQREENLECFAIDGRVTIMLLLEDVRVGDIVDAMVTIWNEPRFLRGHCGFFSAIPDGMLLRSFHLTVRFPAGHDLRWQAEPKSLEPTVRTVDSEREWHWHVTDFDRWEPEANAPSWEMPARWVQVTDLDSWATVAEAFCAVWTETLDDEALVRQAKECLRAGRTVEGAIAAAIAFVQDDIRCLSLNVELCGQIPARPGEILRRRFGDCTDKALLLAQLLRRLGVSARPVLVHSGLRGNIAHLWPMANAFNHAVVEFEHDGARRLIDPAQPLQGGDAFNRAVPQFGLGLPVGPGVKTLETLPESPAIERYSLEESFLVDTSGRPSGMRVHVVARGARADQLRQQFGALGREALSRERLRQCQQMFPQARREGELVWEDDRLRNHLSLTESFNVPNLAFPTADGRFFVFRHAAHLVQSFLALPDAPRRRHALELPFPCEIEQHILIECPSLPPIEVLPFSGRGHAFHLTVEGSSRAGRLALRFHLRTRARSVPPADWLQHRADVEDAWPQTVGQIELAAGDVIPWQMLEAHTRLARPIPDTAAQPPRGVNNAWIELPAIAPALASNPARIKPEPVPEDGETRIFRPNPVISSAPAPRGASAQNVRRRRRKRRKKTNPLPLILTLLAGLAVAVGVYLAMKFL